MSEDQQHSKQDLMVIVPNLITASALACGFSSMMFALHERFFGACVLIVLAAIFDTFDGRVARMLDSESEFGAQFDSLCDLVCFGVAPVILAFKFCLFKTGSVAWGVGFFYIVSGAMRLAKFNLLRTSQDEKKNFSGLPIPMAALSICAMILMFEYLQLLSEVSLFASKIVIGSLMVVVSALMISKITYPSFKNPKVSPNHFKIYMILFVLILAFMIMEPIIAGSIVIYSYLLLGPYLTFIKKVKG